MKKQYKLFPLSLVCSSVLLPLQAKKTEDVLLNKNKNSSVVTQSSDDWLDDDNIDLYIAESIFDKETDDYNNNDSLYSYHIVDAESQGESSQSQQIRPPLYEKTQDRGWHTSASLLYWKNMEENLSYGIRTFPPSADQDPASLDPAAITFIGDLKTVKFDWDFGFRVNTGYRFGLSDWDLYAEYTYFYDTGSNSQTRSRYGSIPPFDYLKGLFYEPYDSNVNRMTSHVTLHYHVLDFVLENPIFKSKSIIFKFLFGGRGAWIDQDWKTRYFSPIAPQSPDITVKNDWDFKGGGLRAGFNLQWFWWYGLGLHFQATAGAILGSFHNHHANIEKDSFLVTSGDKYLYGDVRPHSTRIIPTYQFLIGLEWRKAWSHYGITLFADWEINSWVNLNQTYRFPLTQYDSPQIGNWDRESVALQGLTAGLGFEF